MHEPQKIIREERLEEIGNRDAFHLALLLLLVVALALGVAGIVAWNSRFMIMTLPDRPAAPKPEKAFLRVGGRVPAPALNFARGLTAAPNADVSRRDHDASGVSGAVGASLSCVLADAGVKEVHVSKTPARVSAGARRINLRPLNSQLSTFNRAPRA